ncbi:hypothetical protein C465_13655 [Halorubrum distributum JCM 9100]|uniref:Uncharacterized protein n=2 Tax=Halorubrum distributum TaxID=29283 RepID=M0ECW0_9EURY|nr:hypothetical protein [Halorubrum distributum]ELZ45585.1 hypothetical protein C465_13655 [Halorubrum distributum JCM 9100]ELZ53704.1 hypothetical protein C466_07465 [Halorubrum distributum JCM 10118]
MLDWDGGGAPNWFGIILAYPKTDLSGTTSRIFDADPFSGEVRVFNVGGQPEEVVNRYFAGNIGYINYEPNSAPSSPVDTIIFINGSSTAFNLENLVVTGSDADYDYAFAQYNGGRNYWPMVDDGANGPNTAILQNRSDTNDTVVYEGPSGDVSEESGGTLTTPIACLGDLTTVS